MSNEAEMREIFRELSLQNQAKLTVHARRFRIVREEKKDEKAFVNDGIIYLYSGNRNKNSTRPNGDS